MSAQEGLSPAQARSHTSAGVRRLEHILRSHGVLTQSSLCTLSHSEAWPVSFKHVLHEAVDSGRVIKLADGFYEAALEVD